MRGWVLSEGVTGGLSIWMLENWVGILILRGGAGLPPCLPWCVLFFLLLILFLPFPCTLMMVRIRVVRAMFIPCARHGIEASHLSEGGCYACGRPEEVIRLYRLLDLVHEGCPGHGPIHALVARARRVGFQWDSAMTRWDKPGLPGLSNLACPVQHFKVCYSFCLEE